MQSQKTEEKNGTLPHHHLLSSFFFGPRGPAKKIQKKQGPKKPNKRKAKSEKRKAKPFLCFLVSCLLFVLRKGPPIKTDGPPRT
jgi:hypothetical protein